MFAASSSQVPLYNFTYSYYDENSIIQTEEGTGFYRPKFPELTLEGLTHIENTGLIWSVTTPYVSSKYERGFNVEATIYRDFITSSSKRIRLSAISKACSPVSGWDIKSSSVFTPNFFA